MVPVKIDFFLINLVFSFSYIHNIEIWQSAVVLCNIAAGQL